MGAVTSLLFCSNRISFSSKHILAIIADSPFSSFKKLVTEIANQKVSFLGGFLLEMSFHYINEILKKMISGYDVLSLEIEPHATQCTPFPALFCYSLQDTLIHHTHSQRLLQAYSGIKESFIFTGNHND